MQDCNKRPATGAPQPAEKRFKAVTDQTQLGKENEDGYGMDVKGLPTFPCTTNAHITPLQPFLRLLCRLLDTIIGRPTPAIEQKAVYKAITECEPSAKHSGELETPSMSVQPSPAAQSKQVMSVAEDHNASIQEDSDKAQQPSVGSRIKVFWPEEKDWFKGSVAAVNAAGKCHILYDDGDTEWITLSEQKWEALPVAGKSSIANHHTVTVTS